MPHRLLLADDSVTIQRVIELTFADEDIHVTAVGDGRQAIDRIAAEPPDIVLADVGMPERDGYQVAAFIKDNPDLAHIPVVLLTGAFEPVDEARARQVRCDGVLAKPFEPQLLIARVKELLGRAAAPVAAAAQAPPDAADVPVAPAGEEEALDASHRPGVAQPPAAGETESSLDDYFDRLDQAFASLAGTASRDAAGRPGAEGAWAPGSPPAAPWTPAEPETAPRSDRPSVGAPAASPAAAVVAVPVAEAFAALLEAESSGEARAHYEAASSVFVPAPAVSEEVLDDLVRRVIERLGLEQGQVARMVSEIAERLVREEIERLKAAAK